MSKELLNEREFELVNIVGAQLADNQRALSRQMNLSLGMTNMLIRRLIIKGYIRIKQLNQRKVEYILTPKGFAEKMRKSVNYTLKTVHSIGLIKKQLFDVLKDLYDKGFRTFYVLGGADLGVLVEIVLRENFGTAYQVNYINKIVPVAPDGVILICSEDASCPTDDQLPCVNLLYVLAKDMVIAGNGHQERPINA